MIAETANLITVLGLRDQLSPGLGKATQSLSAADKASQRVQGALKGVGGIAGGAGQAFSHLTGRVGQLVGALGIVGLGGGLIGVTGLLKSSIDEARDFGGEVSKLAAVTGLTTEKTSELAGVFHHFGVEAASALTIAGIAEKNLFKFSETTGKAAAFQAKYGLALRDSSGHILDFNELLLASAKYFNDPLIPAATKAAGLAAIFGRNWQTVIPILKANASGIQSIEDEAKKMGLTLTSANLTALGKLKDATRNWTTALGGLKLQIGLALIPTLTDFTKKLTGFLTSTDQFGQTGSQRIVTFLKDVIAWGGRAAAFIQNNIVPGIQAALDNWNRIPPQIRSLIFKGFAGNATISFLLGFNPVSIATSAAGAVASKLVGVLVGGITGKIAALIGSKAVPQLIQAVAPIPVLVVNEGFGKLPTGGVPTTGPVAGPAGKAGSLLGKLGALTVIATDVVLWGEVAHLAFDLAQDVAKGNTNLVQTITKNAGYSRQGIANEISRITKQLDDNNLNPIFRATMAPTLEASRAYLQGLLGKSDKQLAAMATIAGKLDPLNQHLAQIASLTKSERTDPKPKPLTAADLVKFLATTPVVGPTGRKSVLEQSTNPRRGDDPFGESALGVFERTTPAILKTPLVMAQVLGHITELRDVERYYLSRGDTVAAAKTQTVIEKIERLIGVTSTEDGKVRRQIKAAADNASRAAASDRKDSASLISSTKAVPAAVRLAAVAAAIHARAANAKQDSLIAGWSAIHGVLGGHSGLLTRIANKSWINNNTVNTNVSVSANISVDTLTRTFISSAWATHGQAPNSIL